MSAKKPVKKAKPVGEAERHPKRKTLGQRVGKTAQEAKRTVNKAARNVQSNAARAAELGDAFIRVGQLIQEGAAFLDLMAERVSHEDRRRDRG